MMTLAIVLILLMGAGVPAVMLLRAATGLTLRDAARLAGLRGALLVQQEAPGRLQVIETFLKHCSPALRARQRSWLTGQLTAIAPDRPEDVARATLLLYQPDPTTVPASTIRAIQLGWADRATQPGFAGTWHAVSRMLPGDEDTLVSALREIVQELGPARVSAEFRRGTSTQLKARLTRPGSEEELSGAVALLELVAEPGSGGSRQHWNCVLGDAALRRGDTTSAASYYRRSVEGGYPPARARLAHLLAVEAHRLIGEGQLHRASGLLHTAHTLGRDPEHRLLLLVTSLLADPGAAEQVTRELGSIRNDATDADFWMGVAQLESGNLAGAAESLRRSVTGPRGKRSEKLRDLATSLLIIADAGGDGAVTLARHLLANHGSSWPQHSPVCPDHVVIDVAEREPTLLAELLAGFPASLQLGSGARNRAAHTLLERAVRARHAGLALNRLELAERLLEGR